MVCVLNGLWKVSLFLPWISQNIPDVIQGIRIPGINCRVHKWERFFRNIPTPLTPIRVLLLEQRAIIIRYLDSTIEGWGLLLIALIRIRSLDCFDEFGHRFLRLYLLVQFHFNNLFYLAGKNLNIWGLFLNKLYWLILLGILLSLGPLLLGASLSHLNVLFAYFYVGLSFNCICCLALSLNLLLFGRLLGSSCLWLLVFLLR